MAIRWGALAEAAWNADPHKWNVIEVWITSGVRRGLSQTTIFSEMRAGGLTFGDHPAREIWRYVRDKGEYGEWMGTQPDDFLPPRRMVAETHRKLTRNYLANFSVDFLDDEGNVIDTRSLSLASDILLERAIAEAEIEDLATPELYVETATSAVATLTGWEHRKGWPWE